MLAPSSRLRSSTEIRDVIRTGRRASSDGLTVHLSAGASAGTDPRCAPRAAFVVPRKVGTAVTRNTVTRRLRHLIGERIESGTLLRAGDALVVRVAPHAAHHTYLELGSHLDRCLQKATRS